MHLKSLTVRGFKSFASATTFDFEPGVTAVVGPNGSGKSNVVDALAWVMGEQGVKTLRGGRMEDVIFAGTSGRAPLGRAQVSLTIDNADGALPIEYGEVTISRTLFRAGGSEYAINGRNCRLLDIQELLSDSGLGREMHVIVGQGQLDKVLHATPEDRRGFIEEAAGILKHRRRREKTVRKLESMQANLARLSDLTAELRRQLTPLGKQAEVARRAQQVQFAVRDARSRLLADDLVTLRDGFERDVAAEAALQERRTEVERLLAEGRERLAVLEGAAAASVPALNRARESWYGLSRAREKLAALAVRAQDRAALLGQVEGDPDQGRDPEHLERQAARLRAEVEQQRMDVAGLGRSLEEALAARGAAEDAAAAEDARLARLLRVAADRREGEARVAGSVGAARSRAESAAAELGRLRASITSAEERRRTAAHDFAALEGQVADTEDGEEGLDAEYEEASAVLAALSEELGGLAEAERSAERERAALAARLEAQREGLRERDGSADLLAANLPGVSLPLAQLLRVTPGFEKALSAVLGPAAEAVTVEDATAAVEALAHLRTQDAGQVSLVIAGKSAGDDRVESSAADAPAVAAPSETADVPLLSVVALDPAAPDLGGAVRQALAGVVVVPDLRRARELLEKEAEEAEGTTTAVTRDGDVLTRFSARGGSPGATGFLELRAAVEETEAKLADAVAVTERLRSEAAGVQAGERSARIRVETALERLHESDARMAAVAEKLGQLNAAVRSAADEAERLAQLVRTAEANLGREEIRLREAAERLTDLQNQPVDADPSTERRDALQAAAVDARRAEMDARLALRSREEQLAALENRAASLARAAESERRAREVAAEKARVRRAQGRKAAAVAVAARRAELMAASSITAAAALRDEAEELRSRQDTEVQEVRSSAAELAVELARLTDSVHRDELARAQQRLRIEAVENRAIEELGLTPDHLVAEFGPHLPVPEDGVVADKWAELRAPVDEDGTPVPQGVPFVREQQEKRLKRAERDLASLGKVNPLALEEFAALEERHQFLTTQLADLRATRKDLLDIIREVDERVEQVFTAAYRDTAEQFERVFATLFPGGEGRLVLTDPTDMLTTGIEVEARPAGKRIKRLSLLSGGERSLTAVALLVAIFKARPSPFYVMDEVEAALDDTNLGRLIAIFRELRESSQLIIITHQKRTMEVADALYGVTMRGDGVSTVISQRLAGADGRPDAVQPRHGAP